jgi:hypothetical protein
MMKTPTIECPAHMYLDKVRLILPLRPQRSKAPNEMNTPPTIVCHHSSVVISFTPWSMGVDKNFLSGVVGGLEIK